VTPRSARVLLLCLAGLMPAATAAQDDAFRRPGAPPAETTEPPESDAVPPPPGDALYQMVPVPDRNRIMDALGVKDDPLNPYPQSTLKGDRPVFDDWYVQLSLVLDSVVEPRSVPVPADVVAANQTGENDSFGRPRQFAIAETLIPTLSIIKGDTTFKPPDFEFRFTPAANYNFTQVEEDGLINIDPTRGEVRNDGFVGIQEAFIDTHLRDVSARYDFDSVRAGIQPFNADFRGFLFQDDQLGLRFYGDRDNNRFQYNLAFFRPIEKDTNSGLNDLSQPLRRDDIGIADLFVQDLPVPGFTSEFSVVQNIDRESAFYFDKDGFLTRPAAIGAENPHKYNVTYLGFNGDGHFGWLNLTHSFYYALGNDDLSEFSQEKALIRAWFFAAEPSIDIDWLRLRGSFAYASGDHDPFGRTETGFDSILENPQFAGADTSYWIRQAIPLIGGGGVALSGSNALLPALRSSESEGQSNFINPGLVLIGAGFDADILPELRFAANLNHLNFQDTSVLEALREQSPIHDEIGWDLSGAFTLRPFDTQNVVMRLSAAMLLPGRGFDDLYTSEPANHYYYSVLSNIVLSY
jgi:hypothetical protein